MIWILAACGNGGSATTSVEASSLKVIGGGSASYRNVPSEHAGVLQWGDEASRPELRTAARVGHDYLVALVQEDWPKACSHLNEIAVQQLVASHPKDAEKDCTALLALYAGPRLRDLGYESDEVAAQSLRSDGTWAFLLYRAAGAPYYLHMVKNRGTWEVNLEVPVSFNG